MTHWRLLVGLSMLSGTALAQHLVETVQVPSNRAEPIYSTQVLARGTVYQIQAAGTFSCWGDHTDGVDAYYCDGPWRCGQPELWGQLLVDETPMADLAKMNGEPVDYRPDHVYVVTFVGKGAPVKLQIADARTSAGDNRGALHVYIYQTAAAPPPAGVPAPLTPPPAYPPPAPAPGYPAPPPYYGAQAAAPAPYAPPPARRAVMVTRPRWGLFGAGLGLFLGGYLLDIGPSYALSNELGARMSPEKALVPLAGPWIQLSTERFGTYDYQDTPVRAFLIFDAILQFAGFTMAVLGISLWHRVPVYADSQGRRITFFPSARGGGLAITF